MSEDWTYDITQVKTTEIKEPLGYNSSEINVEDSKARRQDINRMKDLASELGYAKEVKDYKENPDNYKGHVGDISMVLRVALTTKSQTPNLYEIMKLFGKTRIKERFNKVN